MVKIIDNLSAEYMNEVKNKFNAMIDEKFIEKLARQIDKHYKEKG